MLRTFWTPYLKGQHFGLISEKRSCDVVHFLFNNCSEIPHRSQDICNGMF